MSTTDEARTNLLKRREELLGQLGKIEADFRHDKEPLDKDSEEQSVQLENDDVLKALDDRGRTELGNIDRALKRIDEGEYGICARCEEPIAPSRLRALPTAEYCIRCAESAETR